MPNDVALNKFEISAPGKVILNGEHSVVYGKHAIAGPIGMRTYFKYERRANNCVGFEYRKLGATCKMSLEDMNLFLTEFDFLTNLKPADAAQMFKTGDSPLFKYVSFNRGLKMDDKIGNCVTSTLYLLNHIFRTVGVKQLGHAFHVIVDSDMSIGAGMGSSASFGAVMAAGLYVTAEILSGRFTVEQARTFSFSTQMLKKVSAWAFDSEVIMHEKPSGIDNTICTFGDLIIFKKGETPKTLKFDDQLQILIVDSNVGRSTSKLVARVAEKSELFPKVCGAIFQAMEEVVIEVQSILASGTKDNTDNVRKFETLVTINNQLLRTLDVSHPKLEQILAIAAKYDFAAKITGAGGGGCVFVLLPSNFKTMDKYRSMCDALTAAGFSWTQTSVASGTGVDFKMTI